MGSNDDLTPSLVAQTAQRTSHSREGLLREAARIRQEMNAGREPSAEKPDPQREAVAATLRKPSPSVLGEVGSAVMGGARDAAQELIDFVDDSANWLNDNFINLRTASQQRAYEAGEKVTLPEVSANETTAGKVARSVAQFVLPFTGYLKATKAAGLAKAGMATRGAVAGAATDATAFDPHEKRVSNFLLEISDSDPVIGGALFNYLAADPSDSKAEGRFKNALEGTLIGGGIELTLRTAKLWKASSIAKGRDPVSSVNAAVQTAEAPHSAAAAHADATKQAATQEVEGPRGLFDDMHQPVDDEAVRLGPSLEASLKRSEVAAIAPAQRTRRTPSIPGEKVDALVTAAKEGRIGDLAKTLDESDFNFANIDTPEDVKELIDGFSAVFEKEIDQAKHGVQSFADIKQWAAETGAGSATMKELSHGTDNLAGRVTAHRILLTASAEKVQQLVPLAVRGDADGILALRKHVALHASMQAQMKGVQTEIARALSAMRIQARSVDLAINERSALIEAMGGHDMNVKFAKTLQDIAQFNPGALNAAIRKGALARSQNAVFEMWVNGLLSSPVTHAVNAMGNGMVAIGTVAERLGAAAVGRVLRNPNAVEIGEVKTYLFGVMEGMKDALRLSANGLRTMKDAAGAYVAGDAVTAARLIGESGDVGTAWKAFATDAPVTDSAAFGTRQLDLQTAAITPDNLPALASLIGRSATEYLGVAIRAPGRVLATTDELFKTMLYRGELKAQAYRKAASEGLEGEALFKRLGELIEDPTPELSGLAIKAAREGTFTAPLGEVGQSAMKFIQTVPGARYIVPFVRTPGNIMKYTFDRTPVINMMAQQNRAAWSAGGVQRDMLIARTAFGGSLYAMGAYLAAQGVIVGHSSGLDKDRSADKLAKIPAYSVKVGDTYLAFNRMDPIGMLLGLAADFQQIAGHVDSEELDKLAGAALVAIQKNLVSKQYLSGVVEFFDDVVAADSATAVQRWTRRFASSFVPFSAGMTALRKEADPEVKEIWSLMDAIKAKVPGLSKDVLPHVDLFGEDVHYQGGLGPDIASPILMQRGSDDPGAAEVARLNVDLRHPLREIAGSSGGPGIELDGKQYHRLMKILGKEAAGKGFKRALNELVRSPQYAGLPEDMSQSLYQQGKEQSIRLLYAHMKQAATQQLLLEDESLRERFMQHQRNKGNAVRGNPVLPIN